MKKLIATRQRQTGFARAFNLTELLVVVCVVAMLAAVLLSVSFTTQERVLRAECASNLKKIGSAVLVYAGDNNDYLPMTSWHDAPPSGSGNPWQTYEACRMAGVGSRMITEGPYGLGLLFYGNEIRDPKTFYCPAVLSGNYAYSTYAEPGWPWPSIPADYTGGNAYVRCSYNYYPQSRTTETLSTPYGIATLPLLQEKKITMVSPNPGDPAQPSENQPIPFKTTDMNQSKAMAVDKLDNFSDTNHKTGGVPAGVNVLFGDGHVKFVGVNGNNTKNSWQPFDPRLWDPFSGNGFGPASDPSAFRIIMNGWMP